MLYFCIGTSALTLGVVAYKYYQHYRRRDLEEKQLQMFLEELVLNVDIGRWEVQEKHRIKSLKPD